MNIKEDEMIYLREISGDPELKQNATDTVFNTWTKKGLIRYWQMFNGNEMDSSENISTHYNIPNNQFYRYWQVRSYLESEQIKDIQKIHPLLKYAKKNCNGKLKNTVSKVYKILQEKEDTTISTIKVKWEEELGTQITDEEWKEMFNEIHKTTDSVFWREFAWKINMRYFLTPENTSKYKRTLSSQCWRNCGENNANYLHIFYPCKLLNAFWLEVFKFIEDALKNPWI